MEDGRAVTYVRNLNGGGQALAINTRRPRPVDMLSGGIEGIMPIHIHISQQLRFPSDSSLNPEMLFSIDKQTVTRYTRGNYLEKR